MGVLFNLNKKQGFNPPNHQFKPPIQGNLRDPWRHKKKNINQVLRGRRCGSSRETSEPGAPLAAGKARIPCRVWCPRHSLGEVCMFVPPVGQGANPGLTLPPISIEPDP